jgi:protein phosphatase
MQTGVSDPSDDSETQSATSIASASHHTLKLLANRSHSSYRSLADAASIKANPAVMAEMFGMTDPGKVRAINQDQFLIAALERSLLIEGSSLATEDGARLTDTPQGRLLIVADGIGGHGGGEVASAVAIDAMAFYAFAGMPWVLSRTKEGMDELAEGLQEAMKSAQARVRRVARRKGLNQDLGTTLTMAYIAWPDLYIVHAGDSRAYLHRERKLHQLTRDHTLAQQLVEVRQMSREEADRTGLGHVLVNAVGGRSDALRVDLHNLKLSEGDQLLLCTDGLYGYVDDDEIGREVDRVDDTVESIVRKLVSLANEAGGGDNITAILARF